MPATVLVVDDNEDIADAFSTLIRLLGCNAVVAYDGSEAIQRASEYKPHLVLMDIRMPGMDGLEATRRILALPGMVATPIVAVSAHCEGDWIARARAAGCVQCLEKPVDPGTLVMIVKRYAGHCY